MAENVDIAEAFEEIAELLELAAANPFRIRAYRNAARALSLAPQSLATVWQRDGALPNMSGIGPALSARIIEMIKTGSIALLVELRQRTPPVLRELVTIPGIGPKRAVKINAALHPTNLNELHEALDTHAVRELKGFGPRLEDAIRVGLGDVEGANGRVLLDDAEAQGVALERILKGDSLSERVALCGSFRRQRETIGDLDFVAVSAAPARMMDRLAAASSVQRVESRGDTRMTVRLKTGLQVDLRVVPETSWGAALIYFTGSKAHNIALRRLAQMKELKLNEYGLFRGEAQVAGASEEAVYAALGLAWIPPELREDTGELIYAASRQVPRLVARSDLLGDLHVHTAATDGRASLFEMVTAAQALGYHYIAITDHSHRVAVAKGLDPARLAVQWNEIDALQGRFPDIRIMKGVEVDILADGQLDLPDETLARADWVIAAIHYQLRQSREVLTRRMIRAIEHPLVNAIAHPTGRLLNQRRPINLDLDAIFRAAAAHGKALEINGQPSRLDLNDGALRAAARAGAQFIIDSDAHDVAQLGFVRFGAAQARRAGLSPDVILNTKPFEVFWSHTKGGVPLRSAR